VSFELGVILQFLYSIFVAIWCVKTLFVTED
jgi:hypothetical protein